MTSPLASAPDPQQDLRQGGIAVIDYGSQYTQLIARRLREQGVYAEVFAHDADETLIEQHAPRGYVLSGGPNSVYESSAPMLPAHLLRTGKPILGICYGLQLLTHALGGSVAASDKREYGDAFVTHTLHSPLLDGLPPELPVWMSHGDRIEQPPKGFVPLAQSEHSPYAAIGDTERALYGVQFHPEEIGRAHV